MVTHPDAFRSEVFITHFHATPSYATCSTRKRASSSSMLALPPVISKPNQGSEPISTAARKKQWQAVLQQRQLNRNTQLGPAKFLMPSCSAVYQALPPKLRPDVEELRRRTTAGEFGKEHRAAMLSMIFFQSPAEDPQTRPLLPPAAEVSLAADGRRKLDLSAWIGRMMESGITETEPEALPWPSAEERRCMDSEAWTSLMKRIVDAELKAPRRPVERPASNMSAATVSGATADAGIDARWIAVAALTFPALSTALLNGAPITEAGLGLAVAWPQLRVLSLAECPLLRGFHLRALAGCAMLTVLDVSRCPCLETLQHVPDLPQLKRLQALDCPRMGESRSSSDMLVQLKTEVELQLQGCSKLTRFHANLPDVVALDLSFLEGLQVVAGSFQHLKALDLSYCTGLVEIPGMTFKICPALQAFTARNCAALEVIKGLNLATELQRLQLPGCVNLRKLAASTAEESEHHGSHASGRSGRFEDSPPLRTRSQMLLCPSLTYLDIEQCSSLSREDLSAFLRPHFEGFSIGEDARRGSQVGGAEASTDTTPAVKYKMLKPIETLKADERVEIVDFWATEASLEAARVAMQDVMQTAEDVTNKEAELTDLVSRKEATQLELNEANEQLEQKGLKGKKLEKAQEAAQAAEAALEELGQKLTEAEAALEAAKHAKAAAPDAARATAKLKFVYRMRSTSTGATVDVPGELDGEAFEPVPMDDMLKMGPLVIWPPHVDASMILADDTHLAELEQEVARLRVLLAVRTCRSVTTSGDHDLRHRPEWRRRAEEELHGALDAAEQVLPGGIPDFPLLRSTIAAGLTEVLPSKEVRCFLGSGLQVVADDYQMHEVGCEDLREPVLAKFGVENAAKPTPLDRQRSGNSQPLSGIVLGVCTQHLHAFQEALKQAQEKASAGDRAALESVLNDIASLPRLSPTSVAMLADGMYRTADALALGPPR
mmetsp:Transcript_45396/g.82978  ORF Transcript_45396/g.82978 Transcript_45396/m.82978 type:complete len:947 (-) Transcript_45396:108-2948(-)